MGRVDEAIQEGLRSAEEVRRIVEEISSIFEEFSREVRAATQGRIEVDWRRSYLLSRQTGSIGLALAPVARDLSRWVTPNLGTYQLAPEGYPVLLTFGVTLANTRAPTTTRPCADRQALSEGLADLLRTPQAGQILKTMLPGSRAPPEMAAPMQEKDPGQRTHWEVLGIPFGSSVEVIRAAFKRRCLEYHPDRVAHLGERLRAVAEQEIKHINRARDALIPEPKQAEAGKRRA